MTVTVPSDPRAVGAAAQPQVGVDVDGAELVASTVELPRARASMASSPTRSSCVPRLPASVSARPRVSSSRSVSTVTRSGAS